jgi:RNA recognition motif-containing protein
MSGNQAQAKSLWFGDIESWMDESFIIKAFQNYAQVKNIKLIRDKSKSSNLGYGFVEFESSEIAREILENLNGTVIPETNR